MRRASTLNSAASVFRLTGSLMLGSHAHGSDSTKSGRLRYLGPAGRWSFR